MIISSKQLTHFSIHALDDKVGGIRDILFDDETFTVRYLVADTNTWLPLSRDEHKPVSREYEENLFKYFGYGYYWIGPGAWGEFAHPNELVELQRAEESETETPKKSTNHLRAVGEVGGYEVATTTDNVGHISNFVIDTESWKIIMLVVDTNNWLPGGKHLALLPSDIESIDWAAHSVVVNLSHDELVDRPEVESEKISEEGYVPMLCEQLNKNGN